MTRFKFIPDSDQAHLTNQRMHAGLYRSLAYLVDMIAEEGPDLSAELKDWRRATGSSQRLQSAQFGAYYDAVEALQADDVSGAVTLLRRIFAAGATDQGVHIRVLGHDFDQTDQARIERYMGAPETGAAGVTIPDAVKARKFEQSLRGALDWIARHAPGLHGEMNSLLSELILVGPVEGSLEFEGGTCFRLWGGVALNAERRASVADLIVTLAHEEGHAALFGACTEEMLVENPDSELYWSPIRQSERPLEGIFHASFVSARMIWVIQKMLESGEFGWLDRRRLRAMLEEADAIQRESADIVHREGRLTETGQAVLTAMTDFMAETESCLMPA